MILKPSSPQQKSPVFLRQKLLLHSQPVDGSGAVWLWSLWWNSHKMSSIYRPFTPVGYKHKQASYMFSCHTFQSPCNHKVQSLDQQDLPQKYFKTFNIPLLPCWKFLKFHLIVLPSEFMHMPIFSHLKGLTATSLKSPLSGYVHWRLEGSISHLSKLRIWLSNITMLQNPDCMNSCEMSTYSADESENSLLVSSSAHIHHWTQWSSNIQVKEQ